MKDNISRSRLLKTINDLKADRYEAYIILDRVIYILEKGEDVLEEGYYGNKKGA